MNMNSLAQEYEYDEKHFNKEGKLEGIHVYTEENEIQYSHLYKNGLLQEATNYKVIVLMESPVKGIYKDGKPFEGYFVYPKDGYGFNLADYYQNGQIISQYSMNRLKGEPFSAVRSIITSFKDGKIQDGMLYKTTDLGEGAHLIATEHYKSGKRTQVDLAVVALNYGDVVQLDFLPNGYSMSEKRPSKLGKLKVAFDDSTSGIMELSYGEKSAVSFHFTNMDLGRAVLPKPGVVRYYKRKNGYCYQQLVDVRTDEELLRLNHGLLNQFAESLWFNEVIKVSPNDENDYSRFFADPIHPSYVSGLLIGENGKPVYGVLIELDSLPNTFKYTSFKDGAILKSQQNLNLEQLDSILSEMK
jgi:hypothetical protein